MSLFAIKGDWPLGRKIIMALIRVRVVGKESVGASDSDIFYMCIDLKNR